MSLSSCWECGDAYICLLPDFAVSLELGTVWKADCFLSKAAYLCGDVHVLWERVNCSFPSHKQGPEDCVFSAAVHIPQCTWYHSGLLSAVQKCSDPGDQTQHNCCRKSWCGPSREDWSSPLLPVQDDTHLSEVMCPICQSRVNVLCVLEHVRYH